MRAVLEAMGTLKIDLGDSGNRIHVKAVLTYVELGIDETMPESLAIAIKQLWKDRGVQV